MDDISGMLDEISPKKPKQLKYIIFHKIHADTLIHTLTDRVAIPFVLGMRFFPDDIKAAK